MTCPRVSAWLSWHKMSWICIWKIHFSPAMRHKWFFKGLVLFVFRLSLKKAANTLFERYFQVILSSAPTSTIWHQWPLNPLTWPPLHGPLPAWWLHLPCHPTWPIVLHNSSLLYLCPQSISASLFSYIIQLAKLQPWLNIIILDSLPIPEKLAQSRENKQVYWQVLFKDRTLFSKGFQFCSTTLPTALANLHSCC